MAAMADHAMVAAYAQAALEAYESDGSVASDDSELMAAQRMAAKSQAKKRTSVNKEGILRRVKELQDMREAQSWVECAAVTVPSGVSEVPDAEDDLQRELIFYQAAHAAVQQGIAQFEDAGEPFHRPPDYFAEMIKSDEHMEKVKSKLLLEQRKMEAVDQRRAAQRNRKFAKRVQDEKLQEKAQRKREAVKSADKYRRAKDLDTSATDGPPAPSRKRQRVGEKPSRAEAVADGNARRFDGKGPSAKRRFKDKKFGFGGSKKLSKQNDAKSASDVSGFSARRNKDAKGFVPGRRRGAPKSKGSNRPGKDRRQATRAKRG